MCFISKTKTIYTNTKKKMLLQKITKAANQPIFGK